MNLWKKLTGATDAPSKPNNEWIAVYLRLSDSEFGTPKERDEIHRFTERLNSVIQESKTGVFDGDEFGNGECGLFMYGPDADRLFAVVLPLLKDWEPLKGGYAIKRYGAPPDQRERVQF
jgi:hypothetical protein